MKYINKYAHCEVFLHALVKFKCKYHDLAQQIDCLMVTLLRYIKAVPLEIWVQFACRFQLSTTFLVLCHLICSDFWPCSMREHWKRKESKLRLSSSPMMCTALTSKASLPNKVVKTMLRVLRKRSVMSLIHCSCCRPQSDYESYLNIAAWFNKHLKS